MADDLQLDVAGIKAQLVHIASSIEELKESLAPLKELGHAVARMDERISAMQKHQDALALFRENTNDFVSRAKGGMAVALFLFTLVNGIIGWGVSYVWSSVTRHDAELKLIKDRENEPNLPNRQPR